MNGNLVKCDKCGKWDRVGMPDSLDLKRTLPGWYRLFQSGDEREVWAWDFCSHACLQAYFLGTDVLKPPARIE